MGAIPVLDLRLLTQADINALAGVSSSGAGDSRRWEDIVIPKIDRSVFNESAGSRKQTYSRLRLAPRKPPELCRTGSLPSPSSSGSRRGRRRAGGHSVGPSASSPADAPPNPPSASSVRSADAPHPPDADGDSAPLENGRIVLFLRQLFAGNGFEIPNITSLPPVEGAADYQTGINANPSPSVNLFEKGRIQQEATNSPNEDCGAVNANGAAVYSVELRPNEEVFEEHLARMTEGLVAEEHFLEFLGGLEGKWANSRKRRKIVNAANIVAVLPKGWKLLLGLKRKNGSIRLHCRRYISPTGNQFDSWGEVSSYLLSCSGLERPGPSLAIERTAYKYINDEATLPASTPYISRCERCNVSFYDKDSEVQHHIAFHRRGRKRSRFGKSITDGVIMRDGKYECQYCHKMFAEKRKYNGHVGVHVRFSDWGVSASEAGLISPFSEQLNSVDHNAGSSMSGGDPSAESINPHGGDHANGVKEECSGEKNTISPDGLHGALDGVYCGPWNPKSPSEASKVLDGDSEYPALDDLGCLSRLHDLSESHSDGVFEKLSDLRMTEYNKNEVAMIDNGVSNGLASDVECMVAVSHGAEDETLLSHDGYHETILSGINQGKESIPDMMNQSNDLLLKDMISTQQAEFQSQGEQSLAGPPILDMKSYKEDLEQVSFIIPRD